MSQLKRVFGVLGLMVALGGIALGYRWLVWVAIALLGLSIGLRIVLNARARRAESANDGGRDASD